MTLNAAQRRVLEEWMRSKAIVKCPCCGQEKLRLAAAAYVRALLEEGAGHGLTSPVRQPAAMKEDQ